MNIKINNKKDYKTATAVIYTLMYLIPAIIAWWKPIYMLLSLALLFMFWIDTLDIEIKK